MPHPQSDSISSEAATTLSGLFSERVKLTPQTVAYRQYDRTDRVWRDILWQQMADEVARWQAAMREESLEPGERASLMLGNCREWVAFDQAALGLGLVTVPLYTDDRPENVAYILKDADARVLLVKSASEWQRLEKACQTCHSLQRIVLLDEDGPQTPDKRVISAKQWLPREGGDLAHGVGRPNDLATIVYTSGTTGQPKGVMLSNANVLSNAESGLRHVSVRAHDLFLSFLPLSHTLERTVGYYLPMMAGATVAFARGINDLPEDLLTIRPTVLVSVPRIFERVHSKVRAGLQTKSPLAQWLFELAVKVGWNRFELQQGRGHWAPSHLLWPLLNALVARKILSRLGNRLRLTVCGGAALSPDIAHTFVGLGLPILQGYGLTESSPCISVNRIVDNIPASIGTPIRSVEVRIGEHDELLARGPNIMLGYWKNEKATREAIDSDGWLHTGDQARVDESGHLYITGRLKEIIVMSNGEKASPADMEMAIAADPLFDQTMVLGEGRPFLAALIVLNREQWYELAQSQSLAEGSLASRQVEHLLLQRIGKQLHDFPGYAQVRHAAFTLEPWTIENGLLTPTMKLKRAPVLAHHKDDIERLYKGH